MERLYPQAVDVRELSPLTLALVGDGVYELMVRERLCCLANRAAGELQPSIAAAETPTPRAPAETTTWRRGWRRFSAISI